GCWISAIGVNATGNGDNVFQFSECDPDVGRGVAGFEIAGDKLVVVLSEGEVRVGSLTGQGMHKVGEVRIGDWGDVVDQEALADDTIYIVTQKNLGNNPQQLVKVKIGNGQKTKIPNFAKTPSHFKSDGKNLYWTEDNKSVFVLKSGSSAPELVKDGFAEITDL